MNIDESEFGPVCEAMIKATNRVTPQDTDEVREIVLHIGEPSFRYLEGESIGVIVPGPHAFGNEYHMRRYSIANAGEIRDRDGIDLSILVRRCFYVDEFSGERYPGVASNFLCDARPGDEIILSGPYRSPFQIPADDGCNLLMIGIGTGIAPFRAFIQHIYDQRGGWQGQVRLFYGAETGLDLYYLNDENNDLADYYSQETFRAIKAVAGRPLMGADEALARSLEDNAATVWDLVRDPKTHIFVAGLSKIADSMDAAMGKVAGSEEAWQQIKQKLKGEHRWSELLYS